MQQGAAQPSDHPAPATGAIAPSAHHPAVKRRALLFCTAFAFFAVFAPMGNLPSDTEYSIATAKSLVRRGSLAIENAPHLRHLKNGRNGKQYSKYGIGYAVLFIPAIAAAEFSGPFLPGKKEYIEQIILSYTNTVFASVAIVLFYMLFTSLGYTHRVALAAAACIACASLLLPYSKIIHAEVPTTLLLLVFIQTQAVKPSLDTKQGILLGLIVASLVLIKPGNICYSFFLWLYGAWLAVNKKGTINGILAATAIASVSAAVLLILNYLRFGAFLQTGYGPEQWSFTTPLLAGLAGLLFSPSKSMFIFSPLVIVSIAALPCMYRRKRAVTVIICCLTALPLLFYAKWHDWHGGWSWGPRLIVPSVLLLHCFLAEGILLAKTRRVFRYLAAILAIAGLAVNLTGALVWYQQMYCFHRDHWSIIHSHPVIASKLLANKLRNRPEVYSCADFGCDSRIFDFEKTFHVIARNDSIDFSEFEKFQGLAVMWDGARRNFSIPFLWLIPVSLLLLSVLGFLRLWGGDRVGACCYRAGKDPH